MGIVKLIRKWDFFSHENFIIVLTIVIIIIIIAFIRTIAKAEFCFKTANVVWKVLFSIWKRCQGSLQEL